MTKRHCTLENCICDRYNYRSPEWDQQWAKSHCMNSEIVKEPNLLQKLWAKLFQRTSL